MQYIMFGFRANKPDTLSSLGRKTPKSEREKRLGNFLETNEPGIFQPQQPREPLKKKIRTA